MHFINNLNCSAVGKSLCNRAKMKREVQGFIGEKALRVFSFDNPSKIAWYLLNFIKVLKGNKFRNH